MANQNSANQDYQNNADGAQIAGGTTKRILKWLGANITITGSGSNTHTFPSSSDTLVGRDSTDTLTNKTLTSPTINTPTGIVKGDVGLGNVDNTSDATKNSASATLTNKTIDGDDNTITNLGTSSYKNGSVIPDKLGTGADEDFVATRETTTSDSYTDLSTAGPAVTVTIGANGLALVSISAGLASNGDTANMAAMSFAVSGANTQAAADTFAITAGRVGAGGTNGNSGQEFHHSGVYLLTGLTPGSTTFTCKYKRFISGTGTQTFVNRRIAVTPL